MPPDNIYGKMLMISFLAADVLIWVANRIINQVSHTSHDNHGDMEASESVLMRLCPMHVLPCHQYAWWAPHPSSELLRTARRSRSSGIPTHMAGCRLRRPSRATSRPFPTCMCRSKIPLSAATRVTLTATHTKPVQLGPGTPTFQPTRKKLSWSDIEIWRVTDGKFVEHWDQSDLLGLARQLRAD